MEAALEQDSGEAVGIQQADDLSAEQQAVLRDLTAEMAAARGRSGGAPGARSFQRKEVRELMDLASQAFAAADVPHGERLPAVDRHAQQLAALEAMEDLLSSRENAIDFQAEGQLHGLIGVAADTSCPAAVRAQAVANLGIAAQK